MNKKVLIPIIIILAIILIAGLVLCVIMSKPQSQPAQKETEAAVETEPTAVIAVEDIEILPDETEKLTEPIEETDPIEETEPVFEEPELVFTLPPQEETTADEQTDATEPKQEEATNPAIPATPVIPEEGEYYYGDNELPVF